MARFSLSPPAKPTAAASAIHSPEFQWKFPPSNYDDGLNDTGDDTSSSDESSEVITSNDESDDHDDEDSSEDEEEPPHPLGFELYGRTRFGLSPCSFPVRASIDENAWNAPVRISRQNHVSSSPYRSLNHRGISTSTLLRGITEQRVQDDGGMDRIENLLKAATISDATHPSIRASSSDTMAPNSKLMQLAAAAEQYERTISSQMSQLAAKQSTSYQNAVNALMSLLEADKATVLEAQRRMDDRKAQRQKEEEEHRLQLQLQEEKEQAALDEELRLEELKQQQLREEKEAEELRIQSINQQRKLELEQAEAEERKKNEYIYKALNIVSTLNHQIRPQLAEFDTSKSVSKRRLAFKKIVNGKINTLSHDEMKIKEVASLVVTTIHNAMKEDNEAQDEVGKLGKSYLMDLLASNLIVRVQADGFNGTRGDGFPIGAAFALISSQCKGDNGEELNRMLEGHLYRVCPSAVPALEMEFDNDGGNNDAVVSEEDRWMEKLGMIREKNGDFESFDKFLQRTEGLISVMANIMSSLPSDHTLLGGHQGAITWLERFLHLLPPPPAKPLPLTTAPVLVAFLTGAGHMLANKFEAKFKPLFDSVEKDILDRLDDSPVGVPSATRLKKVMEGGFDGIKKNMPAGAIESLYDGKEGTGTASTTLPPVAAAAAPSGFGSSQSSAANANPFGQSPFGQHASTNPSPFGAVPITSSPFGQSTQNNTSGFGNSMMDGDDSNPSGGFGASSTGFGSAQPSSGGFGQSTPFGGGAPAPSSAPASSAFGSTAPSPFGGPQSTPFGASTASAPSPFGGTQSTSFGVAAAPSPSPFGGAQSSTFGIAAPAPSPFGGTAAPAPFGSSSSVPSPFGSSSALAPSPFGGSNVAAPSPFGAFSSQQPKNPFASQGSSSFGSSNSGGFKKDTRAPCKFFAKGNCRYGANCKFSHGDGAPSDNTTSFSSFGSSFGGGGGGGFGSTNSNPSPFGSSGFGNPPSNPFGGPRR
ncbi:hypothetical protein ACHAWO_002009 [Cyclotella atomus]|uniref:mRNA export factor GLE1 n=1 Tax=Cyclotella atomus TaxID=382360 RepID=A0ABD3PP58_9STRA